VDRDRGPEFWMEGARRAHDEWWNGPVHLLLFVAALTLLVLGIVWLVRTLSQSSRTASVEPPSSALGAAPVLDPALAELRLRYARGDVDRDTYLRSFADLTGRTEPWPGQEETTASG
jgi:hypothetical protein